MTKTSFSIVGLAAAVCALLLSVACMDEAFMKESTAKFADQQFKSAIALVELHKIRTGEYPASLEEAKFPGDWDKLGFDNLRYERLLDGYALDIIGPGDSPLELTYPADFWKGLGLARSNVKRDAA